LPASTWTRSARCTPCRRSACCPRASSPLDDAGQAVSARISAIASKATRPSRASTRT
jgi:hypothetical protein